MLSRWPLASGHLLSVVTNLRVWMIPRSGLHFTEAFTETFRNRPFTCRNGSVRTMPKNFSSKNKQVILKWWEKIHINRRCPRIEETLRNVTGIALRRDSRVGPSRTQVVIFFESFLRIATSLMSIDKCKSAEAPNLPQQCILAELSATGVLGPHRLLASGSLRDRLCCSCIGGRRVVQVDS